MRQQNVVACVGVDLGLGREEIHSGERGVMGHEPGDQVGVQRMQPRPQQVEVIEGSLIDAEHDDGKTRGEGSTQSESGIEGPRGDRDGMPRRPGHPG